MIITIGGEGTGICPDGSDCSDVGACVDMGIAFEVEDDDDNDVDSKGK